MATGYGAEPRRVGVEDMRRLPSGEIRQMLKDSACMENGERGPVR